MNNTVRIDGTEVVKRGLCDLATWFPFYAYILSRITMRIDMSIPTIGVNKALELVYNPQFFELNNFSNVEVVDIMRHEVMHLIHLHVTERGPIQDDATKKKGKKTIGEHIKDMFNRQSEHQAWNIACDTSINQLLRNIPKKFKIIDDKGEIHEGEGCTIAGLSKQLATEGIGPVEPHGASEYYYDLIKQFKEKTGQGPDGVSFDIHFEEGEGDGSEAEGELAKEKLKALINQAVREAGGLQAGSVPGELVELIKAMNYKPRDWRGDLRKFVAKNTFSIIEPIRNRRNRRMPLPASGLRYEAIPHIAVVVDSSGSVPSEYLSQFLVEINAMSRMGIDITYIECDADIQTVEKWDKPRTELSMKGRGGTRFLPAFERVVNKDFVSKYGNIDGLIYLSDMENFEGDELKQPKFPVLWARLEDYGSAPSYDWGMHTSVSIKKKG